MLKEAYNLGYQTAMEKVARREIYRSMDDHEINSNITTTPAALVGGGLGAGLGHYLSMADEMPEGGHKYKKFPIAVGAAIGAGLGAMKARNSRDRSLEVLRQRDRDPDSLEAKY